MPSKTPHTTIRFEPDVRDQLAEYCRRTRLSLTAAVNALVSEALAEDFYRRENRRPSAVPRPDAVKVCPSCDGGYYGASCPECDPPG